MRQVVWSILADYQPRHRRRRHHRRRRRSEKEKKRCSWLLHRERLRQWVRVRSNRVDKSSLSICVQLQTSSYSPSSLFPCCYLVSGFCCCCCSFSCSFSSCRFFTRHTRRLSQLPFLCIVGNLAVFLSPWTGQPFWTAVHFQFIFILSEGCPGLFENGLEKSHCLLWYYTTTDGYYEHSLRLAIYWASFQENAKFWPCTKQVIRLVSCQQQ